MQKECNKDYAMVFSKINRGSPDESSHESNLPNDVPETVKLNTYAFVPTNQSKPTFQYVSSHFL